MPTPSFGSARRGVSQSDVSHAADSLLRAGERPTITQVAVACVDAPSTAPDAARMPCGACRQWLAELAPDATYYVDGVARDLTLSDLLPDAFRLER